MSSSVVWCKQCMKNMCQKLLYTQYSTTFPNLLYKQYMHISLRKTITHFNQWEQQRGKWEEKSSYQLNSRSITTLKSCDFTHPTSCLTYVKKKKTLPQITGKHANLTTYYYIAVAIQIGYINIMNVKIN